MYKDSFGIVSVRFLVSKEGSPKKVLHSVLLVQAYLKPLYIFICTVCIIWRLLPIIYLILMCWFLLNCLGNFLEAICYVFDIALEIYLYYRSLNKHILTYLYFYLIKNTLPRELAVMRVNPWNNRRYLLSMCLLISETLHIENNRIWIEIPW